MNTLKMAVVILSLFVSSAVAQENTHKFFDKTNVALFSAHAVATAWDGYATARGTSPRRFTIPGCTYRPDFPNNCFYIAQYPEGNPLARPLVKQGTAGVVAYFSLEVAGNIAGAYLAHRTGHHKIERVLSVVNIGFSVHGAQSWVGVK